MKVVIMAGGKGTRIASINSEVPKPMIKIIGKPILEYEIESLKKQGCTEFIIVVGHLGNVIMEYFGDGSELDISIKYVVEKEPLGTAGALYFFKDDFKEDFLLINGDIIFDIDVAKFLRFHQKKGGLVTLFTHPNNHPFDSGVIVTDNNCVVIDWLHKEEKRGWYHNRVNAGIHLISPMIFNEKNLNVFDELKKVDLDRDVLKPLIQTGNLYAYDSPEYVKDMGTPERYYAVEQDIQAGLVNHKNLSNKQRAIFLDRDGTINKYVGFLRDANKLELLPGVSEAVKMINCSGYLAIVVTNQPVVARGEVTYEQLGKIHDKMETLLGYGGAYLDAIYYCPHHPHKGYPGEVKNLKINCNCRKPKPGMLLQAALDYNIDLSQSWLIGDGENDIKAGKAAGCKTALISDGEKDFGQDVTVSSVLEFVNKGFIC